MKKSISSAVAFGFLSWFWYTEGDQALTFLFGVIALLSIASGVVESK